MYPHYSVQCYYTKLQCDFTTVYSVTILNYSVTTVSSLSNSPPISREIAAASGEWVNEFIPNNGKITINLILTINLTYIVIGSTIISFILKPIATVGQ